jgi:2-dehydro-3-deoxyglucarate aldolase
MQIPNGSVAEIMGASGFDWVAVDLEHGSIDTSQLPGLFRALELGGTLPLARIAEISPTACKHALDAGAGGVIVPMIESRAQLEHMRDACRWPPAGRRGVGFSRANIFGQRFDRYREEAQSPLLIPMIESCGALDALDDILSTDGIDAVLIGPYDLSASLGCTGDFGQPRFTAAMEAIRAAAQRHQVAPGIHVVAPDIEQLRTRVSDDFRFIAYSLDAVMLASAARRPNP